MNHASPSKAEVRARVAEEHAALRTRMDAVTRSLEAVSRDPGALWNATLELCARVERHLDYEETTLVPLLADADAWGDVRVSSLEEEHRTQRTILTAIVEDVRTGARATPELADDVAWFVRALARDLVEEERLLTKGDTLREDPVVLDQSDG